MKKLFPLLKNKFFIAFAIFSIYGAFLDEYDVFTIFGQQRKLSQLEDAKNEMEANLKETRNTLEKLKFPSEVERYAREKKYFKKDDEDVYVIFAE